MKILILLGLAICIGCGATQGRAMRPKACEGKTHHCYLECITPQEPKDAHGFSKVVYIFDLFDKDTKIDFNIFSTFCFTDFIDNSRKCVRESTIQNSSCRSITPEELNNLQGLK